MITMTESRVLVIIVKLSTRQKYTNKAIFPLIYKSILLKLPQLHVEIRLPLLKNLPLPLKNLPPPLKLVRTFGPQQYVLGKKAKGDVLVQM